MRMFISTCGVTAALLGICTVLCFSCGGGDTPAGDAAIDDNAADPDAPDDAASGDPAGDDVGEAELDAPPDDDVVMMGELIFGIQREGTIEAGTRAHGYTFYGIEGIVVSADLVSRTGLTADFRIESPVGDGEWGPVLKHAVVYPGTAHTLAGVSIPEDGVYRIVIEDSTGGGGGYGVAVKCDEGCETGICPEPADHVPPPGGSRLKLIRDEEIAVVDTGMADFYVDFYDPLDEAYTGSRSLPSSAEIVDTTAAGIRDREVELIILLIRGGGDTYSMGVVDPAGDAGEEGTYVLTGVSGGTSITAGDADGDGIAEVFVLGDGGRVTMVEFPPMDAPEWHDIGVRPSGITEARSIAAADFDMDGVAELALLYDTDGGPMVELVDVGEDGGGALMDDFAVDEDYTKVVAGDLDGDIVPEIVLFYDGGFWFMDQVSVYGWDEGTGAVQIVEPYNTMKEFLVDVALADTDHDGVHTIALLDESLKEVLFYELGEGGGSLESVKTFGLGATAEPAFLSSPDFDGDSPVMMLTSGPHPAKTSMKPLLVMFYPPAWGGSSDYYTEVRFGEDEWVEMRDSQKIGLDASTSIGYSGGVPNLAEYNIKATVSMSVSHNVKERSRIRKGFYYTMRSSELPHAAGGVLVSWTCYECYTYDIYDPLGVLGAGEHKDISINVPRHMGNVFWTLERYNSLSHEHGLEPIDPGIAAGDPSTYPSAIEDVHGNHISSGNLVIPEPFIFGVPDSGRLTGYYRLREITINEECLTTGFNLSGGLTVGGVSFEAAAGISAAFTHSVWVGDETRFRFVVGPIIDDPETPADEYFSYYYEFSPFIYRHVDDDNAYYAIYHRVTSLGPGY